MDDAELRETLGLELEDTLLVTYHPVTLEYEDTERQTANLLEALRAYENEVVFTYPNADTANTQITQRIEAFTRSRPRTHVCVSLGRKLYPNLLRHVRAVVGNSSSGIIEASTFGVPVVNIGRRQEGRVRPDNVIDVGYGNDEIRAAIGHALTDDFRRDLGHLTNPYGDGRASERIAQILREIELDDRLVTKRFSDWPEPNG